MPHDHLASITLQQLRIFAAVARERSFARAAGTLHLSQPAVSEQIRLLERLLGVRLLDRTPGRKRVTLTEGGEILLAGYDEACHALYRAVGALQDLRGLERGAVRVGAGPCFGTYVLPGLHAAFRRLHPGITVHLEVDRNHRLVEGVQEGRLDLAVVVGPVDGPGLVSCPLGGFDVVLIGPRGHPLAGGAPVHLTALAEEQLVLPDASVHYRRVLDGMAGANRFALPVALEVNSIEARLQAVASGMGVAVVSAYSMAAWVTSGQLTLLQVEGFPFRMPWEIIHGRGELTPGANAFLRHLLRERPAFERGPLSLLGAQ